MSRVKGKNTALEVNFRKILWAKGYRYRTHAKLPGRPDLVFSAKKVAVFIDGCFWHGCPEHGEKPQSNKKFWRTKLEGNRKRDIRTTALLTAEGWEVVRIWEHEILDDPMKSVAKVTIALR
jgi:DNA mismatch endonuclease (patch repair protein)